MGRPRVPPLPQYVVMVDRATGIEYLLTHTGTSPTLTVALSPTLPSTPDVTTYSEYGGPFLAGRVRLFVSGGVLSSEVMPLNEPAIWGARVLTRRGVERNMLEITASDEGVLSYTLVQL